MNNNSNSNSATIVTTVESDLQSLLDPTDINLANLASDVSSNQTTSGEIEAFPAMDSGATGNFEVSINGKLVHSKKAGAGRCETEAEVDAIKAHIKAILDRK